MGLSFFRDKKVFITGHTGFKGSWLTQLLLLAGAKVSGYALAPAEEPALFNILGLSAEINHVIGDVRDTEKIAAALRESKAELVFHLAAQPLVRESYRNPVYTYETNVMGTVNLLEAVRHCPGVSSVVNITTDKVYRNIGCEKGYCEGDVLDGHDPYSNSKSCSELVTATYLRAFFNQPDSPAISTARAGNVIGGGDFSAERIIPDCIRATEENNPVIVRNPLSVRPYQHVLECLKGYLLLTELQCRDRRFAGCYNFGPEESDCIATAELAELFCAKWGAPANWQHLPNDGPHEAGMLKLDCRNAHETLGWHPQWTVADAVGSVIEWAKSPDKKAITIQQIMTFFSNKDNNL